ncbi:acetyl-CoA carboxylase carboxyltransferase subunit alpha [Mycoplasmatota bacterium WC44]
MAVLKNVNTIKKLEKSLNELIETSDLNDQMSISAFEDLKRRIESLRRGILTNLTAWDRVQLARHKDRPTTMEYINMIFDDFIELHGDRQFADDASIVGGIATINGDAVTIIGQQKGKNTEENIKRNFGMPHPEGYRKALRLMKQAEKFGRPIITFIDTPGAYPGLGAEERGQGEAIAKNLAEMSQLKVPVIAIVIGEGGSGGALALGVANKVYMLENSIYSILSPEGYATILWKDASKASEAAEIMKLTAKDLYEFDIVDGIVIEPLGGAHEYPVITAENIKEVILNFIDDYRGIEGVYLKKQRYKKYRSMGEFQRINYYL